MYLITSLPLSFALRSPYQSNRNQRESVGDLIGSTWRAPYLRINFTLECSKKQEQNKSTPRVKNLFFPRVVTKFSSGGNRNCRINLRYSFYQRLFNPKDRKIKWRINLLTGKKEPKPAGFLHQPINIFQAIFIARLADFSDIVISNNITNLSD